MFQFKQFSIDQTGCAMKINTDGVLLGALAEADHPKNILDIGTGTGVIALMLAHRFATAETDAVEIDESAARTAQSNFENSPFAGRLKLFESDFQHFFNDHPVKKYDLIISNPPFHLNSLKSPEAKRSVAKHTGAYFFKKLVNELAVHLTETGSCWLIVPLQASTLIKQLAAQQGLHLQKKVYIHSFEDSEPHREVLVIGNTSKEFIIDKFVIYETPKVYSEMYKDILKDFFTIF